MESDKKVLPGAIEIIKQSFTFYRKNHKILISIALVPFVLYFIQTVFSIFAPGAMQSMGSSTLLGMGILLIVISIMGGIVQLLAQISIIKSISELDKGSVLPSIKEIYKITVV